MYILFLLVEDEFGQHLIDIDTYNSPVIAEAALQFMQEYEPEKASIECYEYYFVKDCTTKEQPEDRLIAWSLLQLRTR